ncbi:hypothetical protein [Bradyrhizobium sp. I71]|jgi:hypothetical protein|uniref:hypothetical protein n=1 Tax=Bradyrhizobium sp. I71 TaxID=2590772 RepID=UPI001EF7E751|nr:hypothetical protein [Bradyrhizobium sp. I71]ULL01507.1 hypothetical protein FJV43_17935 [Bradyrhizobium sp. I71]
MRIVPMFEAHLPEFSGFASPGWAALLSGPRLQAAQSRELIAMNDHVLDAEEYLEIFEETVDEARQRSALSRSFFEIFRTHLSAAHDLGEGLRFQEYDAGADRVVAGIPLPTVMRIVGLHVDDGTLPAAFAPLAEIVRGSGERAYEIALRRLRPLDRAVFGELLQTVTAAGLEKSAITAIAQHQAEDAFEHSVDWSRFWTLVEARWRGKVAEITERSLR